MRAGVTATLFGDGLVGRDENSCDPVPLFRLLRPFPKMESEANRLTLEDPRCKPLLRYLLDNCHLDVIQNANGRVFANGPRTATPLLLLNVC